MLSLRIELNKEPEIKFKCQHILSYKSCAGGATSYICLKCGRKFHQVSKGSLLECSECGRKREKSEMLREETYGKYGKWSKRRKYEVCLECEKKRRDTLHA